MKKFQNVLLVNDDGINEQALLITKELLNKYCERIVVVVPKEHQSGASSSLTLWTPCQFSEVSKDVYTLSAKPVDCVAFAMNMLKIDFDLVVSGCNNGENICYDVFYSGTVGAALEANKYNKKVLCLSTPRNNMIVFQNNFDIVFKYILDNDLLSQKYVLSVNFPNSNKVEGIKVASLCERNDTTYFEKNDAGYVASRDINKDYKSEDDDWYCFNHEIVSIVPLSRTLYIKENLDILKSKIKNTK